MRVCIATALVIIIAGCGQRYQWWKDGISQQQANQDTYECLKESQQRVSGAYVGPYGGTSENRVVTNQTLYNACIAARGYYQKPIAR
jgi:hypothetical protein